MIQRCLYFVDTFEALIYYIRWYKLKKGGPTLSVDSPNIDQHKKSALLCSKALSGAPSGTLPGALLFTHHIRQAIESVAATDSVFVFMGVTERLRQSLVLPMKR